MQPISAQTVCYFSDMEPVDPRDQLWKNISELAKVPDGSARAIAKVLGKEFSLTTLQRIKTSKAGPTTDTLLKIAKALRVEVWQLLTPPGAKADGSTAPPINIDQAIDMVALALGGVAKADRGALFTVLEQYADDPKNRTAALFYVREALGGALNQPEELKKSA